MAVIVAIIAIAFLALTTGQPPLSLERVLASLCGTGTGMENFVLLTVRIPRFLTSLLVGAALAVGGAIFQSISRNPLGSPDIMGFNAGAATGGLIAMFIFNMIGFGLVVGAIIGGLSTAACIYFLSMKKGVRGYRLILIGIGISPLLSAFNTFILTRANVNKAQDAAFWLTGSLNGAGWEDVWPVAIALGALLVFTQPLRHDLDILEMGDELAASLGVRVEGVRRGAIAAGVGLAATATACAGPVSFVALSAPHITRGLTPGSVLRLSTCCLVGALLLSASDLLAQRAIPATSFPVGIVTGALGGIYLAGWLIMAWRRSSR
ncbi:iron chelate uptake ABC transporter family permease subunit (plasmid) [Rhizobium sp. CB3060]|uniref:FecCD family ABC transporter permease n=1 Tax=Rhizobium sp. CB3060 TaxID=3138255 RepID=UPI0021A70C4D|nr:iron chelate uptake ABC transporter family permease subunit [Rhizobium tropici]UWU26196.1 iron chelate uptake ABC transporter family permease subunit [Rhizobium tropici]